MEMLHLENDPARFKLFSRISAWWNPDSHGFCGLWDDSLGVCDHIGNLEEMFLVWHPLFPLPVSATLNFFQKPVFHGCWAWNQTQDLACLSQSVSMPHSTLVLVSSGMGLQYSKSIKVRRHLKISYSTCEYCGKKFDDCKCCSSSVAP